MSRAADRPGPPRARRRRRRPAPIRFGAGPIGIAIHAADPPPGEALRSFFGSFGPPPARPRGTIRYDLRRGVLHRGGDRLGRAVRPLEAADRIVLDLGDRVPALARGHICLHAGAVSARGRGLLLPAAAKGGKSTLTLGMVRRGCTYYSDDMGMIDLRGRRLLPFPRPIDLRGGAIDLFPRLGPGLEPIRYGPSRMRERVPVRVDRRRTGRAAARVRWIVFPRVRLGRPTVLSRLRRAEALMRLCRLSFNLDRIGERGFGALVALVEGADCYTLEVGRLRGALGALSRLVRG